MKIKIFWVQLADREARYLFTVCFLHAYSGCRLRLPWRGYNSMRTLPQLLDAMSRCAADWAGAPLPWTGGWWCFTHHSPAPRPAWARHNALSLSLDISLGPAGSKGASPPPFFKNIFVKSIFSEIFFVKIFFPYALGLPFDHQGLPFDHQDLLFGFFNCSTAFL